MAITESVEFVYLDVAGTQHLDGFCDRVASAGGENAPFNPRFPACSSCAADLPVDADAKAPVLAPVFPTHRRIDGGRGNLASPKQLAFIERLAAERGITPDPEVLADLTKGEASERIEDLLAIPLPTVEPLTDDEVRARIGSEKFTAEDMTPAFCSWATAWVLAWDGDFAFLLDMKAAAERGQLSNGQAKGVANCFRAQVAREATSAPESSRYRPEPGEVHKVGDRIVRAQPTRDGGGIYGKVWDPEIEKFVFERGALAGISADTLISAEEAAAFGHATGACCFCSRMLTDDRSTTVGYGPVCASKFGLPWGDGEEVN